MNNSITITLNYGTDMDFPLTGKFTDKASRKVVYLLHDYRVLVDIAPSADQKVFKFPFSKNNRVFNFEWASSDETKSLFAKWLKLHPLVKHSENKNADPQTYFLLADKSREDETHHQKEKEKVAVWNMVNNMDAQGLIEVAYFKMIDPAGKTPLQIFNTLCRLDTGILMQNPLEFIAEWKTSDRDKKVVIRKAIMLDIIQTKSTEGRNIFLINNTPIGSVDNLLVYFNENPEQYTYLVKQVSEKDTLPFGVAKETSVVDAIKELKTKEPRKDTTLSAATKEENKKVRDAEAQDELTRKNIQVARLKELNVKGWAASAAWSEDVRLKKIKEAEGTLVEA
jgi:hypothetical protein